ncbi:MAG: putative lipid II flippase FtsW [Acidothermus sp.]|nr:putative lipid II flippase FtsW [Acidothermus sp.]MCL6537790.1 putative lipid II flippase FtsW [Acidothermus sp.]
MAAGRLPLLGRPLASFYLVLACSCLLTGFGLVMVWSASYVEGTRVSLAIAEKQALWVGIGLPLMIAAAVTPLRVLRWTAYPLLIVTTVALLAVLVPGLGVSINGARRWLAFGGLSLQPSELAKLALVIFGADLLARKQAYGTLDAYRHLLIPLAPISAVLIGLVLKERDLGTSLVLMAIVLVLLWVVGTPLRLFVLLVGLAATAVAYLAISEPYRLQRLLSFGDPFSDLHNTGWQAGQGIYALGSGGWWGLGLGNSREKWGYLPQAHNDFIFAIIGEELGLVGSLAVLAVFAVLAYAGIRVAQRSRDSFARLAACGITAWITVQALVNIGAVIGLLPITGIPLPLISAGGSSLIPTMVALGVLMSLARHEPAALRARAARGPGRISRVLRRFAPSPAGHDRPGGARPRMAG